MAAAGESVSGQLADWCAGVRFLDVPERDRNLAGLRVLDTVGLVLVARDGDPARIARSIAERNGGTGAASLIGADMRLPASWSAFAHGVAAHANDFDDTFLDSVVHSGSTAIPVALAVGEEVGASGEETAAAIVVGYEVAARIGGAAARGFHARGFHATGTVGPFVAAAVAGRLYGLDGARMADAFGLAGSMSSGLMAFMADGAWSKWLHTGWSAHGGIVAAQMAARGFRGPASVLDGENGLFAAFVGADKADPAVVLDGLGTVWRGGEAHFKYYPCAHVIQPYIDAALTLRAEHGLTVDDVADVECAIAPWAIPIVCEPRAPKLAPSNALEAIASLPYLVAVGISEGHVGLGALAEGMRRRGDILRLAERVRHVEDPALGVGFDGLMTVRTRSGDAIEIAVTSAPPVPQKVIAKFHANADEAIGHARSEAVVEALVGGVIPNTARLMELVGGGGLARA